MDDETMCELFLEADKLLNGNTDIQTTIKNFPEYHQYCPDNKKCSNRAESIGALSAFLFTNFYNTESSYYEHFMMWLGHYLFKIAKKRKNVNLNIMTLSSAYNKYLEKSTGNLSQWNIINDLSGVKDPNLRHMSELYTLLKHICNTFAYYKKNKNNKIKTVNLLQNSVNCLNQYRNLYKTFSKDDSYLPLLEKLKKIYDDFRTSAINDDIDKKNNIEKLLLELTPINEKDSHSKNNLKTLDSNGSNDQLQYENTSEISKEKNTPKEQKDPKIEGKNNEQSIKLQNSVDQTSSQREEPSVTEVELKISGNEEEDSGKSQEDSEEQTNTNLSTKTNNQTVVQEQSGAEPEPQLKSQTESPPPPQAQQAQAQQAQAQQAQAQQAQVQQAQAQQAQAQAQQHQPSLSQQEPEQEQTQIESQKELAPQQESSTSSSSETKKQEQLESPSTQENSLTKPVKGLLNNFFKPYFLSFYDTLTDYENRLYESVSTSLTKGYSAFNKISDDLINHLNKVNDTLPSVDNNIHQKDSESNLSPSDSPSETPSSSSTQSSDNKIESEKHETNFEDGSEDTISEPEGGSQEINSEQPTPSPEVPSDGSPNVASSLDIGIGEPGINVEKGIFEIGFPGGVIKGYKLLVYAVIIIAIPIILAFMYRYFSFGWRKELKKKKNMKKVINMFGANEKTKRVINPTDRKKKVQIIINLFKKKQDKKLTNSSTQKKQTKQFINSICWEKYPLLNIYKLMETDPVPFIILYLVFIFYVYRRK
ncbi:BIR protein [Plasmodium berghei]|uniref:BIR protein n=1 Tax=Plasmodium berghei TaxID=5821 RepID=A0A1D3JP64_PLABE|nr:BIR protein [Plasmodium berghei]